MTNSDVRIILSAQDKASPVVQAAVQRINASYSQLEEVQGAVTKGFAVQHQTLFKTLDGLQQAGHAAETVTGVFMAMNIQQLRQFEIQNRVIDSQYALNEAIQQYGPDSIQAEMAARSLSAAQREQSLAAQEAQLQWIAWGTSLIGVAAQVASAVLPRLAALKGAATAASTAVNAAGVAGGLGVAAGAALPVAAAAFSGVGSIVGLQDLFSPPAQGKRYGTFGEVPANQPLDPFEQFNKWLLDSVNDILGWKTPAGFSQSSAPTLTPSSELRGATDEPTILPTPQIMQEAGSDYVNSFNDNSAMRDYATDSTYNQQHWYSSNSQYDQSKSFATASNYDQGVSYGPTNNIEQSASTFSPITSPSFDYSTDYSRQNTIEGPKTTSSVSGLTQNYNSVSTQILRPYSEIRSEDNSIRAAATTISPTTNNFPHPLVSVDSSANPILYNQLYNEAVRGYNTGYALIENSRIEQENQSSTENNEASTLNHQTTYDNSSSNLSTLDKAITQYNNTLENQELSTYAPVNSPSYPVANSYQSQNNYAFQPAYGYVEQKSSSYELSNSSSSTLNIAPSERNYTTNNATAKMFPLGMPADLPIPTVSLNQSPAFTTAINPDLRVNPLLTDSQAAREIQLEKQYYPGYAPPEGVEMFPDETLQQAAIPGYNITVNPMTGEVLYQQELSRHNSNSSIQYDSNNVDNYNPNDFNSYTNQEMQNVLNSVDQSGDSYNSYQVNNHPFGTGPNVIAGGGLPDQAQINAVMSEVEQSLEQAFSKIGSFAGPAAQALTQNITINISGAGQSAQAIANQVKQALQTNTLYGNFAEPPQSSPVRR